MKKWAAWIVLLALIPALAGCTGEQVPVKDDGNITENPELTDGGSDARGLGSMESFSFSLEWGGHGESYDSKTGSLTSASRV